MRRRFSWAVLGISGALAVVVATMMMTGGPDVPPSARIIVPQAENTEIAMPHQSTVDIPTVPYAAASTEINTPETAPKPKPKPKPPTSTQPSSSPAPPPPTSTVTPTNNFTPWWYTWYVGNGGHREEPCRRCR